MSLHNILWGDIHPFIYILYIKKTREHIFAKQLLNILSLLNQVNCLKYIVDTKL